MIDYNSKYKIYLPESIRNIIVDHCLRKFSKKYLPIETHEQQAYGMVAGSVDDNVIHIGSVYTCNLNYRNDPTVVGYINGLINKYAIPSDTPIEHRGWVASPSEVIEAHDCFDKENTYLIGSYHMHHMKSWNGGQSKNYPSDFDEKLAENSNMIMFIVSVISGTECSIRAFYNGQKEREIEILC